MLLQKGACPGDDGICITVFIYLFTFILADAKSQQEKSIRDLATEGLDYLDTRTDFWRQQKPMYARKRDR